jgi:outer membrane protein OmpA-like peptidoglycan-associated protein
MRHLLLASAAAASLALAFPAFAQDVPNAVPAPPPVAVETPNPDAALEGEAAATVTTPEGPTSVEAQAAATTSTEGPVVAETQTQAEAQANAETPEAAAEAATAMASAPVTPAAETEAAPAIAMPASTNAVCQPRVTSVHFGERGSALSRENRNAIEYAVDAASVCDLQQVQIVDSADGGVSNRRASAVRAALIAQGVPEERISVAEDANADAEASSTGRLDVRMSFAGVADSGTPLAANETAQTGS